MPKPSRILTEVEVNLLVEQIVDGVPFQGIADERRLARLPGAKEKGRLILELLFQIQKAPEVHFY